MHPDKFWKFFWSLLSLCLAIYAGAVVSLLYTRTPNNALRTAAVAAAYDPSHDPFQKPTPEVLTEVSDYLYRDSLTLGFEDWSWGVAANWRSNERHYEGSYSLRVEYQKPGGDVRAHTSLIDLSAYSSLSIAVYPAGVSDMYIELYDAKGVALGKQPLSWYTKSGALTQKSWNTVTIPLANLLPPASRAHPTREMSGFSISAKGLGLAFIDAMQLGTRAVSHPRFIQEVASSSPLQ